MRPSAHIVVTDHDMLQGVGPDDHHARPAGARFTINSQAIAGSSTYSLTVALAQTGCQLLRAILRGPISVDTQGHVGVFVLGTAVVQESSSIGIRPYPGGTQSYMGGYSRLHGDGYLSHTSFGTGIRLNDAYISGSNAVFVFRNTSSVSRNLIVYGSVISK